MIIIVGCVCAIFIWGVCAGIYLAKYYYKKALEQVEIDEMIDMYVGEAYERERAREEKSLGKIH